MTAPPQSSALASASAVPPAERPEPESREERIRRLAVLCAMDRVNFRLNFSAPAKPPPSAPPSGETFRRVLGVTRHVPGAIGRWSRRLAFGASVLRALR